MENINKEFKFKDTLYTKEDCEPLNNFEDVTGKILVLDPNVLDNKYRIPKNQLWKATSGFGTKSYTMGTIIYSECISDGEKTRWERYNFIGVLKNQGGV